MKTIRINLGQKLSQDDLSSSMQAKEMTSGPKGMFPNVTIGA